MSDDSSEELDFVACISHDLKSPLNAILGFAQMIEGQLADEQSSRAVLQDELRMVQGIARDMLAMINNMLVASRIQSHSESLTPFLVSRDELEARAVGLERTFMMEARSKQVDFAVRVHALPRLVYWDIQKIRYFAINNIVSNALKFVGAGGTVRVDIDVDGDNRAVIAVSDDGPGIPPEERAQVFKKYVQSSNNVRSFQGGGFGLFNAAAIVAMHGGRIDIHDGIGGRGVSFVMTIPAVPAGFQQGIGGLDQARGSGEAAYALALNG